MARRQRCAQAQIVQHRPRRTSIRGRTKGSSPPKTEGTGTTLASLLCARFQINTGPYTHETLTAKALIAVAGSLPPHKLGAAHVLDIVGGWQQRYAHSTKVLQHSNLRRVLRWLWEEHGAPKLDRYVSRLTGTRPRNVTATREQIDALLANARPAMRLWLLLCADLGIRSGTALRIGPDNYRPDTRALSFVTKKGAHQTLPVTADILAALEACDLDSRLPFVTQLRLKETGTRGRPMHNTEVNSHNFRQEFKALRLSLGIQKRIVPHDLRRTAAVNMLRLTGDVTTVQSLLGHRSLQSTIWYLDHDLKPLDRSDLEAIKKPFIVWRKEEKTA